jgi:hypothetical protein
MKSQKAVAGNTIVEFDTYRPVIRVGSIVKTDFIAHEKEKLRTVLEVRNSQNMNCESGILVVVEGIPGVTGKGIDANWFTVIEY